MIINYIVFLLLNAKGANSYGQLCLGHQHDKLTPHEIDYKPESICSVTGGGGHTAVISGLAFSGCLICTFTCTV